MNYSASDILLTDPERKIVLWRRMGGSNPGYGLDVDGETRKFISKGLVALRQEAHDLAKGRGLQLVKPTVERMKLVKPAGAAATHTNPELDKMLGRFYTDDNTEYAWAEYMEPTKS